MVLNLQGSSSVIKLRRFIDSKETLLFSARSGSQNSAVFRLSSTTRNIALRHNHHAQAESHYLSCRQTPFLSAKHLLTFCLRRKLHCTFQNSFSKMHKMSNSQNRLFTSVVIYSVNKSRIKPNSLECSFPFTLFISHTLNEYILLTYLLGKKPSLNLSKIILSKIPDFVHRKQRFITNARQTAEYEKANKAAKTDRCKSCSTYSALHREPLWWMEDGWCLLLYRDVFLRSLLTAICSFLCIHAPTEFIASVLCVLTRNASPCFRGRNL